MKKSDTPDLFARLMVDDREITFAYESNWMQSGDGSSMNLHASNSAIIECSEGQGVYLEGADWSEFNARTNRVDLIGILIRKK